MPALSGARQEALGGTALREQVILLMRFRGTVRAGDRIELGVDTRNLHRPASRYCPWFSDGQSIGARSGTTQTPTRPVVAGRAPAGTARSR
jgi:hypothetical protein